MQSINAAAVQLFLDGYYEIDLAHWRDLLSFYGCSCVRRRGTA